MYNKPSKYIRQPCGIPIYIDINKPTGLLFTLSHVIIGDCKRLVKTPVKSVGANKAQALYLFRRLDAGPTKGNRFKPIYCPIIPQTAPYSPLA